MSTTVFSVPTLQAQKMQGYYRIHAKIYDATRWFFLFGRHWLLDLLPFNRFDNPNIVEIGCGTGHNLLYLSQAYTKAHITGVDISADMLDEADKKLLNAAQYVALKQNVYGEESLRFDKKPNCILFSYCLSMVNPNWDKLIQQAKTDLGDDGYIAIVDFHRSSFKWFRKWMAYNHVRMEGHLLPYVTQHFETVRMERRRAYLGLWQYFIFIGRIKQ